jgi:nucleotide sugar dehydrogenase
MHVPGRGTVCVQGLGFVGTAMAVAVASARDAAGNPRFNVVGVDLPTPAGRARIEAVNAGVLPITSLDPTLDAAFAAAVDAGNLVATDDVAAYALADVTLVDIHLDLEERDGRPHVDYAPFRAAIATLGAWMRPGTLIIVETTVPPGTCRYVAGPVLAEALAARGLPPEAIQLAHAYERVMPGQHYLDSVVNFWRVYAADTPAAADACGRFLSDIVNVAEYPLTRLDSTVASETAKVLENSYRAATIAFMEEWGRFAEAAGVNLFEVVDAIRRRPTHSNMRQPGFGVGGYCLTKDPLFATVAGRDFFGLGDHAFPFCEDAVAANRAMPLVSLQQVAARLGGSLQGRRLLLLGVSYREDVGDTRYSPSETFYRAAVAAGAAVACHDPLVTHWAETGLALPGVLPSPEHADAVVLAVAHREYRTLDWLSWLKAARPLIFDANHVLADDTLAQLRAAGCPVAAIGRGTPS